MLVAVFAADHQAAHRLARVKLDVDVLVDVNAGQFQTDHRVVAILDDLGGRREVSGDRAVPVRRRGRAEEVT
ncbi:Uncharacterised protein [Mycobacterium tuberculosis]|uniref:Uncharacterized protein n=1 Tax=Mycobacterium tuberculosis TaxID=1773 RepID=A0A654TLG1_MYCTX|nr:Uncharacterised protein [Mycobacterium tuberculosis]CFE50491.1 Uncharacterised protein [Mycobacterium tuberculosis]CNU45806.1 Uncharacterised protein [Mycobacterium tuberculosis]